MCHHQDMDNFKRKTAIQARFLPSGYVIKSTPRPKHQDGGIALFVKDNTEMSANMHTFRSIQCTSYKLNILFKSLYCSVFSLEK